MGKDKQPPKDGRPESLSKRSRSHYRPFPGHPSGTTLLRVAFSREAYADLNLHTRSSLEEEVGGVLVGNFCDDDNGNFLEIRGTIAALSTRQGKSHITFTHDTWDMIHQALEADFKGMDIVGWYHTHPGFGVEFSDMDRFIHSNFFSPAQVALVVDPVAGETAAWATIDGRQRYLDRIWVDSRETMLKIPASQSDEAQSVPVPSHVEEKLEDLETTVSRMMASLDQFRNVAYRLVFGVVLMVATLAVVGILYSVFTRQAHQNEPPKMLQWVRIPVQIGDEQVYLGVSVTSWDIPDKLKATHRELLLEQLKAIQKEYEKAQEKSEGKGQGMRPVEGESTEPQDGEAEQKNE